MKKLISVLLLALLSFNIFGQTNYAKFKKLYRNNDTIGIKSLLTEWEKANANDPELYTSALNFYFSNSKEEIISLNNEQKNKEGFQFVDSTGKVVGYLGSDIGYNPDKLNLAIKYANLGIEKFPDRLDIRFGKCYLLQQIGDYSNFTKEIIKTVEYSQINKNNWLWTEDKKQEDGEGFMLGAFQKYLKELYDTEDDSLLANMIEIGEAVLKYYNHNVEILSTTSVALMLTKEYDRAIEFLKQAEKLTPKDYIVLNNIAEGYRLKGDKANALKYYKLTEKYGDEHAKQQSRQKIKELKN
jgi:tetratricopeptide (TPR) repeat protein